MPYYFRILNISSSWRIETERNIRNHTDFKATSYLLNFWLTFWLRKINIWLHCITFMLRIFYLLKAFPTFPYQHPQHADWHVSDVSPKTFTYLPNKCMFRSLDACGPYNFHPKNLNSLLISPSLSLLHSIGVV